MTDVFISYSRKNSDFARRLIDYLNRANKDSWVDWEGIPLSSPNWWAEIKVGIEQADNFIFIMSPAAMESVVCNMELDYAFELNKRIIPVVYDEVQSREAFASIADFEADSAMQQRLDGRNPLLIARENWHRISHINWIFFREDDDFATAFDTLIETVETDLAYVKAHTRYLNRAQEWQRENRRSDLLLFGEEIDRAEWWFMQATAYAEQQHTGQQAVGNPLAKDLHHDYIQSSRKADQRRRRITRITQLSLVVFVVVAGIAGYLTLNTNQRLTEVQTTIVPATLDAVATEVQSAQNFADSLQLAARGEDIFPSGETYNMEQAGLGLRLAYEASLIDSSPQTQRILGELAYAPGFRRSFEGHRDWVSSVAYSPDGQFLLSGSYDNSVILWNITTGAMIRRFEGHTDHVLSVAYSPDGTTILSGSWGSELILWDVATGEISQYLKIPSEVFSVAVFSVAFSPDGATVFSGLSGGTLLLWDVGTGDVLHRLEGRTESINGVAYSPDGRMLLAGSCTSRSVDGCASGVLLLWNAETGELLRRMAGHPDDITNVAYSPNGHTFVSGARDGTVILWDAETGEILHHLEGHSDNVMVAYSPDGLNVLSGSCAHNRGASCALSMLLVWDVESGTALRRMEGHNNEVLSVAYSPDGQTIVSGAVDGSLILWDMTSALILDQIEVHTDAVNDVAISSDGTIAISASSDTTLKVWNVDTGEVTHTLEGHTQEVGVVAIAPDGTTAISASRYELILWDLTSGNITQQRYVDDVREIAISPDSATAFYFTCKFRYDTACVASDLVVWNLRTGEDILHYEVDGLMSTLTISPSGTTVIFPSTTLTLWSVSSGEIFRQFETRAGGTTNQIAFSPDETRIITASQDTTLTLWDRSTGEIVRTFEGHTDAVNDIAISPDGNTAISASADSTLILWDMGTGEILRRFEGHTGSVNSVVINPDGTFALSASDDNSIILWRLDSLDQIWEWVHENRYMPEATCQQRPVYGLLPCLDGTPPPSSTFVPNPTPE